ncbi:MAG: DUF4124 domain-containing protein [Burkholderiaceae bacterium]
MGHASSRDGSLVLLFALVAVPLAAGAQVYKCRQPDGSTTFQQVPCPQARPAPAAARDPREHVAPPPSTDSRDDPYASDPRSRPQRAASLPPGLSPASPAPPPRPADLPRAANSSTGISGSTPLPGNYRPLPGGRDERIARDLDALEQESRRLQAFNKRERCEHAKQQLEVAKAEMPIFTRDTNGERHYIEDRDRAANTAARRQDVQAACD